MPLPPASPLALEEATAELLGMLAYGELTACSRLGADAELAPSVRGREVFARLAAAELRHYDLLAARVRELGHDPEALMEPYAASFARFHERTRPNTWLEAVVKAYVGDGIADDFSREIAALLDPVSAEVIRAAMADEGRSAALVSMAREGMDADPLAAGRLALWGRRLHGEAISQAQSVAAHREALAALLTGQLGEHGLDLARLGELFARLATRHTERMEHLGLSA